MGVVHSLMFLLLTMIVVVESSFAKNDAIFDLGSHRRLRACSARIGNCIDETEETMLDALASRRVLAQSGRGRYISYGAMRKNNTPCGKRGSSYYNCASREKANPYSRSCSRISRCARDTR